MLKELALALIVSFLVLRGFAGASGAKLHVSGPALRSALNVFLLVPLVPNSIFLLNASAPPNWMLKKPTLVLRVLFLDFCRVFAVTSGAKLDVSGPVLRCALDVFLQVPVVPNSTCFAGASGAKLDASEVTRAPRVSVLKKLLRLILSFSYQHISYHRSAVYAIDFIRVAYLCKVCGVVACFLFLCFVDLGQSILPKYANGCGITSVLS